MTPAMPHPTPYHFLAGALLVLAGSLVASLVASEGPLAAALGFVVGFAGADAIVRS